MMNEESIEVTPTASVPPNEEAPVNNASGNEKSSSCSVDDKVIINEEGHSDVGGGGGGCCINTKQFFLYDSSRSDIQAFYFNQFGRSVLFISFMFLSLGVLQLANQQAGCPQNENGSYQNCGNRVYGMQPSSMLPLMAIIGGISTSCFMPYAGAVVDFSDHRLAFGRICALLLTLVNLAQIFIFESTWFAMVILQSVIAAATFMANSMVLWSYVSAPTDHDLHGITASGRVWETLGMLLFFIVVAAVQVGSGWDSVTLARFSQALATTVGGLSLFLAYKRYKPVKAVKTLEDGKNLYVAGLGELKSTMTTLGKTQPSASRYLLAAIFVEASMGSFTNLAITYLAEQIEMSATEITIFIMLNLLVNPVGVITHRTLARKIGHKRNYLACVSYTIIITALMVATIHSPKHSSAAFLFSALFGVSYGWYYPSSNGYYVSLVPKEKVTELWGFNSFCSVVLSWVPPIIFAVLNETTGNLRVGWLGVIIFEVIGVIIGFTIPGQNESANVAVEEEKGESVASKV